MVIGLISGAMGPFSNAPIDTIKTRAYFLSPISHTPVYITTPLVVLCCALLLMLLIGLQKASFEPGTSAASKIASIARDMWAKEGPRSFYKGITPRVLRVAPGQAIVFAVYERVRRVIEQMSAVDADGDVYSE